jgi:hypothetical protein
VAKAIAGAFVFAGISALASVAIVAWGTEACAIQTQACARAQVTSLVPWAFFWGTAIRGVFTTRGTEATAILAHTPSSTYFVLEHRARSAFAACRSMKPRLAIAFGGAYLAYTMPVTSLRALHLGRE